MTFMALIFASGCKVLLRAEGDAEDVTSHWEGRVMWFQ